MADSIKVDVNELLERLNQMKNDGMKYVELLILDEEEFDNDIIPCTLSLSASEDKSFVFSFDYEMIEEIQ